MEIFLGVEAIAGLCCIISEVLMIISIYAFEKKAKSSITVTMIPEEDMLSEEIATKEHYWCSKQKLSATVHHLHALVITVLVVNMQHLPFLGIVPVFFTAGMGVKETLLHWFAACTSIGVYTLAFAYFKARY